ncbi:MAG: MFS transporter [Lentisphaeria bacterium]|nr:MFS transporter [Lentisphaeria bacterium]
MIQTTFNRRMLPISSAQFFSSFNEYAIKTIALLIACGSMTNSIANGVWILLFSVLMQVLPILLITPAGFLGDRFPKRYITLLALILEFIVLLCGFSVLDGDNCSVTAILILLAVYSLSGSFFAPALNGLLPEMFHASELSSANGHFHAASLLGSAVGIATVAVMHIGYQISYHNILFLPLFMTLCGFASCMCITHTTSVMQQNRSLIYPISATLKNGFHELFRSKGQIMTMAAQALFFGFGTAFLIMLGFFAKYTLNADLNAQDVAMLRFAPLVGLIIGCLLAGKFSQKKIELGLVPFGAAGAAAFLIAGVYASGSASYLEVTIPGVVNNMVFQLYWTQIICFFFAGVSAGLFIIPIRAFFLQRLAPAHRASAMAVLNLFSSISLVLVNGLFFWLSIGLAKDSAQLPAWMDGFAASSPAIQPQTLVLTLGLFTAIVTFITMWGMPDFALRFLLITLGKIFYKIDAEGTEKIPERGPALLLANHASFIDPILISSCTSRRVRFLMQEEYFKKPGLRWLARLTGFIKVPSSGKYKSIGEMFELVQDALRKGDIVCVFPEGTPSHNGIVGKFSAVYEKMLPADLDVPVIPVAVGGTWGSIFSYFHGPIRFRMPRSFPLCTTITIGDPIAKGTTPFEVRQTITELKADTAIKKLYPHEHPAHYLLGKFAKTHPFHVVMRDADDGKSFTYFKTFLASVLFSREIRKRTSPDSKYVGVLLPNCTAGVLSIMGTLLADRVPCPLNFTASQEILELSIKKAKIDLVLTSRLFLAKVRLQPTPEMVFLEDIVKCVPTWKKIVTLIGILILPYRELLNMLAPLSYDNCRGDAVLLFSSGSTGIPKGVRLTHHNIYSDIDAMVQAVAIDKSKDSIFGNLPMFHSFGLTCSVILPLIVRTQAVVFVKNPLDATLIGEAVIKYKTSILVVTPSFLQTYLRKFKPEAFDYLRIVISGAEKLRADIAEKFYQTVQGKRELLEGYGCTELSPVTTINLCPNILDTGTKFGKKGAIGLGLETMCTRIMDPLTYKPVPPDTEGLLFVKGPNVMKGYLDDPEQTEKVLINGFYNTGDIAKMDETGYVTICGRLSRFSKIAGEMVPHELVECIINEQLGLENRVVAVGSIPDAQKGEALLVLYTPDMPMTPEEVVAELRERSISNLWIPKATNFYPVDALPLLGSGKLDLTVLRTISEKVAAERKAAGQA